MQHDDLTRNDMYVVINAMMRGIGLNNHNKMSYSDLLDNGLSRIMMEMFKVRKSVKNERKVTSQDSKIDGFDIMLDFRNIKIDKPYYIQCGTQGASELFPTYARRNDLPYSGRFNMSVDVRVVAKFSDGNTDEKVAKVENLFVGNIPIMVGSSKCHTYNLPKVILRNIKEDPSDPGGYFLAKGQEYIVDWTENIRNNTPHIYRHIKAGEHVRLEFISQAGGTFDNSSLVRIRYMVNGQITIEIKSIKFKENVKLPFFLLYRIYDMMSDRDVTNTIVIDYESRSKSIIEIVSALSNAFHNVDQEWLDFENLRDKEQLIRRLSVKMANQKISSSFDVAEAKDLQIDPIRHLTTTFLAKMDEVFLPHMGQNKEARHNKLKFLGDLIYKMFLVHQKLRPESDRDNLCNKRMHGAGVSIAKAVKTQINNHSVSPSHKAITRLLKNKSWDSIHPDDIVSAIRGAINEQSFTKAMTQTITTNTDTIKIQKIESVNRVSSQSLEPKNPLNIIASMRNIVSGTGNTSNKTTSRADEMRRVHSTYSGYICPCQSADTGEKVGMRKQIAVTTTMCMEGDAINLKLIIIKDIIPLSKAVHSKVRDGTKEYVNLFEAAKVFVNGELMGYYNGVGYDLARKYRDMRRNGELDKFTTISVDPSTNEIEFWLDVGKLSRPVVIVYNNLDEYDAAITAGAPIEFKQYTLITKKVIAGILAGAVSLDDMVHAKMIEFISPEEMSNCYLAQSIIELQELRHDVTKRFTHCEIEQAILGLAAHTSPFGNHTQPARITLATNHQKQAGGWYTLNYIERSDKNRFFQFYNQMPIINTLTNEYVLPSGMNVIIAYTNYLGDNQEDSAVMSKAFIDRGGFGGVFFKTEVKELENSSWSFQSPNHAITKNIKANANYGKLVNGFVPKGTKIVKDDILIGIVERLARGKKSPGDEKYEYLDKSVQYTLSEDAVVEDSYTTRGINEIESGVVKLKITRDIIVGDKMSSRSGNKSIIARIEPQSNMYFVEKTGMPVDLVINPHSFPSRMAIGQLIEAVIGIFAAYKGINVNGTAFLDVNNEEFHKRLKEIGMTYSGLSRIRNGLTGEYVDAEILVAPTNQQRLLKFVIDDQQVIGGHTRTDPLTQQPTSGGARSGGLKLGEMERDVLNAHGDQNFSLEKFCKDSDGSTNYICYRCSMPAVLNTDRKIYLCYNCREYAEIERVPSTHSSIVLQQMMASSGITFRQELKLREFRPLEDTK